MFLIGVMGPPNESKSIGVRKWVTVGAAKRFG